MEDTLAQWLFQRFGKYSGTEVMPGVEFTWDNISESDQEYWQHEAKAVRRAVMRGGFKDNLRSFARMESDSDRYAANSKEEDAYYNGVNAVLDAIYNYVALECME